jgi:hypothetical protein
MPDPTPTPTPTPGEAQGGNPVATPAPAPGNNPAPAKQDFIATQEQWNQRWAEKHAEIETDLGMSIKEAKAFIDANKKAAKPAPTGETLSGADLKLAKTLALMTAGVASKQIPVVLDLLNISGKTREEIETSIQGLIKVGLLKIEETAPANDPGKQQGPPTGAQGAGNNGVPGAVPAKRWKKSEIQAMTHEQITANMAEIEKAEKEGRIDYNL